MSDGGLTVLITDMEGSTALAAARGDEAAMTVLRVHERLVRDVVATHGGREIKSMGDGFMITFPDASPAVECALDIQDQIATHNELDPQRPIRVRIGVNAGTVIEEAGDIFGTTVNAAARIVAKARPGQVLTSGTVAELVGDRAGCTFWDRGLFWLKGLGDQWRLYEPTRGALVPTGSSGARSPFVDRDVERATLRRHVDRALDGNGGLVLIGGESGSGKSRLAEEIGSEAHDHGMQVVTSRCYEMGQTQTLAPLLETLETIERRVDAKQFRAALGESAGEIARLLPHLRVRFPEIPPAAELPPEQVRRYLFASARDTLAALASARPLYLVWDDLQWADEASLRFLEHLAGELPDLPILVVATYTVDPVADQRPLNAALERFNRWRLSERIELGPLGVDDLGSLLDGSGEQPAPPELIEVLHRATDGNVYYFEELVRHLTERNRLFAEDGRWRTDLATITVEVPETLRLTIDRRLENISEETQRVLARAAVIGRDFGFDLLAAVAEIDDEQLLDALDEAEHSRLVTSIAESGVVRFRFSHDLIRRTFLEEMSPVRRQRLHLKVADAIERVHASALSEHAADIVGHLERAGSQDRERSVRFLHLAGGRALEAAGHEDAERYLRRVLDLLPDGDERRAAVLEQLGLAERSLGRPDDAIATWSLALDAYEQMGDMASVARLALDAGLQVAFWLRGRHAKDLVDRGLTACAEEDSAVRAGLIGLAGALATQAGRYDEGAGLFDEALVSARRHNDERILGMVLYARATHHFTFNEFVEAVEYGRESARYLRSSGDLWNLANVLGYSGAGAMWLARFDEASAFGAEGEAIARRVGNWPALIFCQRAQLYPAFGEQPDLDWYEGDGQAAFDAGEQQGFRWLSALGQTRLGLAAFWRGDWSDALAHFEHAASIEPPGAAGGHLGGLVLLNAYLGRPDMVRELLERGGLGEIDVDGQHSMRSQAIALVAIEACAIIGDDEQAGALLPVAESRLARGVVARGWDYRLMWIVAGIASTCRKEWDLAEAYFAEAVERSVTLPLRLEEGCACRFYAWMLLRRGAPGDDARARELIDRAIDAYERIGMRRHADLARSMITR